jgi:hypothetical protein
LNKDEAITIKEAKLLAGKNPNTINDMKHADMLNEKKMNTN